MMDNPDMARSFMKSSGAQQTVLILVGIALFLACVPAFIIDPTAGSAMMFCATAVFCFGLVYDVKLILDQQEEADKARHASLEVSHLLEKRIAWRWTAVVLNVLGSLFSLVACYSYFPAASAEGKAKTAAIWNANALFGLGTLLFYIGYEIVAWDVVTIRHTLAEMNGERVPYWDTTAKVMWGFGISLGLFAGGNFLILLPEKAFLIAGAIAFLVGAIIITGVTWWQAQFQWDEHVKEHFSGKTGANLGMAGQVLDGGQVDVEDGGYGDEDSGLRTPLLPAGAAGEGGRGGAGSFGAASLSGGSPSFSGRGGPVSVAPGGGSRRGGGSGGAGGARGAGGGGPSHGQQQQRPSARGENWEYSPRGRHGRGEAGEQELGGGGSRDDGAEDGSSSSSRRLLQQVGRQQPQAAPPPGRKKGADGCWTERL